MTDSRIPREEMSAATMGRRQDIGETAGQTEPDKKKRKMGVSHRQRVQQKRRKQILIFCDLGQESLCVPL